MGYKLIQAPADEPVSITEAKAHLRVRDGETSQDALIEMMIAAARQYAEIYTHRAFVTQQWRMTLDAFPNCPLLLQKSPIQSVDSIIYTDMAGSTQTIVQGTDYVTDLDSEPGRITPPFGRVWPIPLPQIAAVRVTFTAGYGEPDAVPDGIKTWIKLRVGSLFENREDFIVGTRLVVAQLPFVDRMLDPYVVPLV